MITKLVTWYFKDFGKYLGFLIVVGLFIAFLQAFLVYPIQVILTIVIGTFAYGVFCFFTEL